MNAQARKVASRIVTEELQEEFAALSGDRNPMHMDRIAARRTQAGLRVAHGVHTLLWSLETLASIGWMHAAPRRIRVKFLKWIYVGDAGDLWIPDDGQTDAATKSLKVEVAGLPVLSADLTFVESSAAATHEAPPATPADSPAQPIQLARNLSFADLHNRVGNAFTPTATDVQRVFPHLSALIGASAVAEIASCSYIVGMEAPGLHSMFSKLDLAITAATPPNRPRRALHYRVASRDERFRKARINVSGQRISGSLDVFIRVPPVEQASMQTTAARVEPAEFAGMIALIVGGSRGLGEVAAKLIAAGGGKSILTYVQGKTEAESVVGQIQRWGGHVETLVYDARKPPEGQLTALSHAPTHLFYFATNTIYKPKSGVFSNTLFAEFSQFYLQGFYELCVWLTDLNKTHQASPKLVAFYPSTIFVEDRPPGMTEYAMVKAAGEQMCRDMNQHMPNLRVVVSRLPRLPTDQTVGVMPEHSPDPISVLLPLVREMRAATKT